MKKQLLIIALMAIAAIQASAQSFKWGVEAGLNMNKLTTKQMDDHKLGFFIGPKIQLSALGLLIDGSLQYSQTSIKLQDPSELMYGLPVYTNSHSKTLPYIVVPVNVKYAIGIGSYASIYVSTGPQWNWYVGSGSQFESDYANSDGVADYISHFSMPRSTFSWNIGVGVHLAKHLQAGVTYNISMNNNVEANYESVVTGIFKNCSNKNNIWQVRLAYMF